MRPAIGAWMRERFPARNAVFFVVFHATALLVARAAVSSAPIALGWRDLPGFVALWAFFLTLRVFDEHKDFAADSVAHPGRVLQTGRITLDHLKVVGGVAVAVQLGVSLWLDGGLGVVTLCWLLAAGWSVLMAREFFMREWLRGRILAYALSHMLVMPLIAIWASAMGAAGSIRTPAVLAFAGLSFLAGMAFEVARKLRAPGDEHPLADSYTQSLGIPGAVTLLVVVVTLAAAAALGVTLLVTTTTVLASAIALTVSIGVAAWALTAFRRSPTQRSAKVTESAVGVAALASHLVPIVSIIAAYGLVLR
jgi:hypothetical protein